MGPIRVWPEASRSWGSSLAEGTKREKIEVENETAGMKVRTCFLAIAENVMGKYQIYLPCQL